MPEPKKLLGVVRDVLRTKQYSYRTEQTQVHDFILRASFGYPSGVLRAGIINSPQCYKFVDCKIGVNRFSLHFSFERVNFNTKTPRVRYDANAHRVLREANFANVYWFIRAINPSRTVYLLHHPGRGRCNRARSGGRQSRPLSVPP
jgi:hypothetical protein